MKKIITTLFLISLFPLSASFLSKSIATKVTTQEPNLFAQSYASVLEDFSNTTYRAGATTATGWGTGGVTAQRNFSWDWLDMEMTTNPITDIAVQGRKVYAACFNPNAGASTMASFDIDEPNNIHRLSDDDAGGGPYSITVEGDVLYLGYAIGTERVNTFNISDPTLSAVVKYLDSTYANGRVTDVEADGHLMYYASFLDSGDDSFRIIDASDPDIMVEISSNWVSNKTLGLYIEYPIAYLAESVDGLYIVNTTVKSSTVEIGHVDTPGNATDVLVDGAYAYVADGPAGVHVVDIRDPTNPEIKGTYDTPGNARKLALQGNTLFVADGSGGVIVLDVVDPNHPTYVTQRYPFPFGDANDVDLYGGILVVGADLGLYTYEIAAIGGGITDFSKYAYLNAYSGYQAYDVRVQGDIAYVAGGSDGLYTLNIRDPSNPILLDQDLLGISHFYRKLEVRGNFAYVTDYGVNGAFRIYDISDPTNIFQTDQYDPLTYGTDVALSGDRAYISDGSFGIFVIDISDPYAITWEYTFDIFSNVTGLWTQGPHLYACEWLGGGSADSLYTLNIKDPSDIKACYIRSRFDYSFDVFVDGDLLYLAGTDDGNGMWIYNVSNPYSMTISDWVSTVNSHGVWGFGPYIISANMQDGVSIINATNPLNIVTGSTYADATKALQVTTHGDYTYVANQTSLVILRHFESAGDTYVPGIDIAQSLEMDSTSYLIHRATLYAEDFNPAGVGITYFMSADGGNNWEAVTPNVEHEFVNIGNDLRWRAEIEGFADRSPHLYEIAIQYFYNEAPSEPAINDPGDVIAVSSVEVNWTASTDDVGIDHYELQVDSEIGFATPINSYNVSGLSQIVTGLTNGTYYFRVRAVDTYDVVSTWSGIADITVEIPALNLEWWHYVIIGGGLVLIVVIIVVIVMVRKRKVTPVR